MGAFRHAGTRAHKQTLRAATAAAEREIMHEPELKPVRDIPVAAAAAQRILKESLDALTYMFEEPARISRALRLMFVARNLERIGDHASNIAEMVIFLVEGQDIRHGQA